MWKKEKKEEEEEEEEEKEEEEQVLSQGWLHPIIVLTLRQSCRQYSIVAYIVLGCHLYVVLPVTTEAATAAMAAAGAVWLMQLSPRNSSSREAGKLPRLLSSSHALHSCIYSPTLYIFFFIYIHIHAHTGLAKEFEAILIFDTHVYGDISDRYKAS